MALPCRFGAIADDFTGGADLAGMLREHGVRTVQLFGIPDTGTCEKLRGRYQAVVLCLKSRSIELGAACSQSVEALRVLRDLGACQIQFKYCSTFDSTSRGNIGPVTEALMSALGVSFTIAVPALPVNGRTQYLGHLFVKGELLSESPMRDHPLNPMRDSNLVRHLQAQIRGRAGLIELDCVRRGPAAIRERMAALERDGVSIALVDATSDSDMSAIAEAVQDMRLITGGSGLARELPKLWEIQRAPAVPARLDTVGGVLILSGSCSSATLSQLRALAESGCPMIEVDVARLLTSERKAEVDRLASTAAAELARGRTVAIRSSSAPEHRIDTEAAPAAVESAFEELARRLVCPGLVSRLIAAGGETSGAVVNALGIRAVEVTGIIDPGVPALRTLDDSLVLALKSGNFGAPDFFLKTIRWWNQQ